MTKYGNKRCSIDGYNFPSLKEMGRYLELKLMLKEGLIRELELQPQFELLEDFHNKYWGKTRGIKYRADFTYYDVEKQCRIVEDVKSEGTKTPVYKLKKKMLLAKYPLMNFIEV